VLQAEIVMVQWSFASDHRNLQLGSATATQDAKSGGIDDPFHTHFASNRWPRPMNPSIRSPRR
jgi:hypothetical protein